MYDIHPLDERPPTRTDLPRLMARWAWYTFLADSLREQIEEAVLARRETVETADAVATYSEGRGSYDYEAMAKAMRAPTSLILLHSAQVTDWRKVCGAIGIPAHLKARFYEASEKGPRVTLKRRS